MLAKQDHLCVSLPSRSRIAILSNIQDASVATGVSLININFCITPIIIFSTCCVTFVSLADDYLTPISNYSNHSDSIQMHKQ